MPFAPRPTTLWGPDKTLDYWAARRAGLVPSQETRAMQLLASMADERRFSFYCISGMFPAMGNVTRRTYLVRRFSTILELDAGVPVGAWCVVTQDRNAIPETDHVVAMKNLIEGEEMAVREIGNRTGWGISDGDIGFPNGFAPARAFRRPVRDALQQSVADWDRPRALRERGISVHKRRMERALEAGGARPKERPQPNIVFGNAVGVAGAAGGFAGTTQTGFMGTNSLTGFEGNAGWANVVLHADGSLFQ